MLAGRNRGDTVHFPGIAGKLTILKALAHGDLAALRLLPRMLRKRAGIRRLSRLTPSEIRRLLLSHRLSLSEVA